MKIVILADHSPPENKGGAGRSSFNLALEFYRQGHKVFLITTTQAKNKEEWGNQIEGIIIYRIYIPYYNERWRAYLSLYNPKAIKKTKKLLAQINPDVVHLNNIHYYLSYYSLKIAKKYSQAVFFTARDTMAFDYGKTGEFVDKSTGSFACVQDDKSKINYKVSPWQQIKKAKKRYNPLRNIIIRHYLKYAAKIIAISKTLKDALNQNGINNVKVIYNGIDIENRQVIQEKIEEFKDKFNLENKKVVLFAGRLSLLKGGNRILEAMQLVSGKEPRALLLVLGREDNYAKQMRQTAKEKGVEIVFTGWIENKELKAAYWASDVVVTPSIYLDPFNLINIEAMVCRRPVVGTCFGGTPEIVENKKTGYIVNPLNVDLMAGKIINLLGNPEKAKQFGEAGYKRVKEKFSLKEIGKEYLNLFQN